MLGYGKLEFLQTEAAHLFTPEDRAQGLPEGSSPRQRRRVG